MIDYRDQIAMMKFYHMFSIFLAIYFHNIGNEISATSPPDYPKICQAQNHITCYEDAQCNEWGSNGDGVCRHALNSEQK